MDKRAAREAGAPGEALQEAELQRRVAARLVSVGAWRLATGPLRLAPTSELLAVLDWERLQPPPARALLRLLAAPERRALLSDLRAALAHGHGFNRVLAGRSFAGRDGSFRLVGDAVRDPAGRVVAVQGAGQDVTRQLQRSRQSLLFAQRLTNTLESITEGFLMLDREWRLLYVNGAAERTVRRSRGELVGRVLWDCFPELLQGPLHHHLETAFAEHRPCVFEEYCEPLAIWLEMRAYPNEEGLAIYFRDVSQQHASDAELRSHRERLEELVAQRTRELGHINDELTAFTLAVAHDLRAPLAAITGFNRAIAERLGPRGDDKTAHYLERMQVAAGRMEAMLGGLIELTRVGQVKLERRTVHVSAVAADAVETLRASDPGRALEVRIQPDLVAHADPALFRTVLDHLLGNAWKFSAGCDPARIEVGQAADGTFFVRDNGAGFDMAYAQNLFAPFQRLHPEGRFEAGAGIGLAAVRRVVQRHGGVVWAESRPGQGTTIHFTLPH